MVSLMNTKLLQQYGEQATYKSEAQYYLEMTEYNLDKALEEFDADLKFEKEQESKNQQFIKKVKGKK